jgi:hypothetical protein
VLTLLVKVDISLHFSTAILPIEYGGDGAAREIMVAGCGRIEPLEKTC